MKWYQNQNARKRPQRTCLQSLRKGIKSGNVTLLQH